MAITKHSSSTCTFGTFHPTRWSHFRFLCKLAAGQSTATAVCVYVFVFVCVTLNQPAMSSFQTKTIFTSVKKIVTPFKTKKQESAIDVHGLSAKQESWAGIGPPTHTNLVGPPVLHTRDWSDLPARYPLPWRTFFLSLSLSLSHTHTHTHIPSEHRSDCTKWAIERSGSRAWKALISTFRG